MLKAESRQDVVGSRRRWYALVVLCVGLLMMALDTTIVFVALPVIQRELHFSPSSLAWVVNAYLLTFGGLLLLAGRLGDLIGRRQVFLLGLSIFVLSSLLCGLASTAAVLVAARFFQGAGAAMVSSMGLGIISPTFPEPRERAKAFSIYAFVVAGGGSLGLVLGGAVTELVNWHWIFFINVPIGVGAMLFGLRVLPTHRGLGIREGADLVGALLVTGTPMLIVYGIINAGSSSWSSRSTVAPLVGAIVLAGLFVVVEAKVRTPLIPLRIFAHRNLAGATAARFLVSMGSAGLLFLGALYFEHVLGYTSLRSGFAFLPYTALTAFMSLALTPRLVRRVELKTLVVIGLVLMTAGLVAMDRITTHSTFVAGILPAVLLAGVGTGTFFMPLVSIAMSDLAVAEAGAASGLTNVANQMGISLGVAILATVSASRAASLRAQHEAERAALIGGYRLGFLVAAGLTAIGGMCALAILRPRQRHAAAGVVVEDVDEMVEEVSSLRG